MTADPAAARRATTRTWKFWTMHDVRAILIGAGILIAVIGGIVLLNDIPRGSIRRSSCGSSPCSSPTTF